MTECHRCGSCCENIYIPSMPGEITARLADPYVTGSLRNSLEFIKKYWTFNGPDKNGSRWECAKFDPETRLCTAHSERPPVCKGYPWYGKAPDTGMNLPARCSFRADVPISKGGLLPIVSVT